MCINISKVPGTEQEPTHATFIVCHGLDLNIDTVFFFLYWAPSDAEENSWLMNAVDLRTETSEFVDTRTCGNDIIGIVTFI